MYLFYRIASIEYKFVEKTLLNYTNLFSLNDYQMNEKLIYKYCKGKIGKRKCKP